jgi:hypothetical protein
VFCIVNPGFRAKVAAGGKLDGVDENDSGVRQGAGELDVLVRIRASPAKITARETDGIENGGIIDRPHRAAGLFLLSSLPWCGT